ncbi:sugar kinase [Streptomyces sp. LZ34]
MRPEDIAEETVARAALLHITGITPALSDSAAEAVRHAVGLARRHGLTVSFDVNYRAKLWSRESAGKQLLDLVRGCDVVFAGREEATLFVPDDDDPLALATALTRLGPAQAVIKLGADGCAAVVDGERLCVPAVPVDAVDPVGAGDAFVAGYLAELLRGVPARARLETAVTTGAFACTVSGDWEGMPTRSELTLLGATEDVVR